MARSENDIKSTLGLNHTFEFCTEINIFFSAAIKLKREGGGGLNGPAIKKILILQLPLPGREKLSDQTAGQGISS